MPTPLIYPATIPEPWARIGSKNVIPTAPDATPGHASLDLGFPPLTMTPIESGGVPPSGLDFNGIFNLITQHTAWQGGGGQYVFDSALVAFTGGYKLGAIIQSDDGLSSYVSLVNSNTDNFNTTPSSIGVTWAAYSGAAASGSVTTVSTTGGTVTLSATQAAAAIINVTGVLASASTIVFPSTSVRSWRITNSTTGAFGMGAKLAAGASLTLTQGKSNTVFYNGSALVFPSWDSGLDSPALRGTPTAPTAAPLTNSTQLATTAYVEAAVTAAKVSPAFSGTPTAPTAAPLTNSTQLATTAYADAAAAAVAASSLPTYINSNTAAGASARYWTDTSAGSFTVTLPNSPVGRNPLEFDDLRGTWQNYPLTIDPGSNTISGVSGSLVCDVSGDQALAVWWDTVSLIWRLK